MEGFREDGGRSALLSFVAGSQWLILLWTVRSLGGGLAGGESVGPEET